jgi:hypothetical protein
VEIAKTLIIRQDRHSQHYKIGELVKQSSRNGRKLIVAEITKTVKNMETNTHRIRRLMSLSNNPAGMEES